METDEQTNTTNRLTFPVNAIGNNFVADHVALQIIIFDDNNRIHYLATCTSIIADTTLLRAHINSTIIAGARTDCCTPAWATDYTAYKADDTSEPASLADQSCPVVPS